MIFCRWRTSRFWINQTRHQIGNVTIFFLICFFTRNDNRKANIFFVRLPIWTSHKMAGFQRVEFNTWIGRVQWFTKMKRNKRINWVREIGDGGNEKFFEVTLSAFAVSFSDPPLQRNSWRYFFPPELEYHTLGIQICMKRLKVCYKMFLRVLLF